MSSNGENFIQAAIEHPEVSVPAAIASAAAIAATIWAFKGGGAAIVERVIGKGDQVSPFISLGGEAPFGDMMKLQQAERAGAVALHPADGTVEQQLDALVHQGVVFNAEPEDAAVARALYMATKYDGPLGRMAVHSVGGDIPPDQVERFERLSRLAAERGTQIGTV
ncbi:MAG TPA: hypothetical protein V6C69_12485 [Trichormus sp.]|jgi:hypothetical protein